MLGLIALLALAGAYVYVSYRFDDPSVPVVADLFPDNAVAPYTLLEIWAHPDDETSMGGTTVRYGRHPEVRVVACYFTCGEDGRPGVPPICTQDDLSLVRRGEMAVAAHGAGMAAHEVADFGDGRLAECEFAALEAQAVRWIRTHRPNVLCSWDPSGSSGHPDHIRTHDVVRAAFRSAADPAAFPEHAQDGLAPHQVQRLYETVVPVRMVELYRKFAFAGNTAALDRRTPPTHAVNVQGTAMQRMRIIRAHRSQRHSFGPLGQWYAPFLYWCWRKEYFTLALTAEATANQ